MAKAEAGIRKSRAKKWTTLQELEPAPPLWSTRLPFFVQLETDKTLLFPIVLLICHICTSPCFELFAQERDGGTLRLASHR